VNTLAWLSDPFASPSPPPTSPTACAPDAPVDNGFIEGAHRFSFYEDGIPLQEKITFYDPDYDSGTDESYTVHLVKGPTYGTLEMQTNGQFTYTPGPDNVQDSFTYYATDVSGLNSSVYRAAIEIGEWGACFDGVGVIAGG